MEESPCAPARETRRVVELRPSKCNPRRHDAAQIDKLKRSIRRFGWTRPLLVTADGEIIAGEACWRAARELQIDRVPVVVLDQLDARAIEAYRVADNRLALDSSWDDAQLAALLREFDASAFDLAAIGFDDAELAQLLEQIAPAAAADQSDQAVPPPAAAVTKFGDVWQLGEHRLICGDSTKPETYATLLVSQDPAAVVVTDPPYGMSYDGGRARRQAKVDLVFTDPPYGMAFGKGKDAGSSAPGATVKAHGMILGDDLQGSALVDLVASALGNAMSWARAESSAYVCLTWRTYPEFAAAMERASLSIDACIVWDKGSVGLGFQHYRPRHEFILYHAGRRWHGGNAEGDVWTLSRGATGEYVHPTQKPVALIERALENSSLRGDVVLDPFGGSGSTLIACERLQRRARLIELDPKYCDAIVRRWETFSSSKANGPIRAI